MSLTQPACAMASQVLGQSKMQAAVPREGLDEGGTAGTSPFVLQEKEVKD